MRFSIREYQVFMQNWPNKGGIFTFIKNSPPTKKMNPSQNIETEVVGSIIQVGDTKMKVYSNYCLNDRHLSLCKSKKIILWLLGSSMPVTFFRIWPSSGRVLQFSKAPNKTRLKKLLESYWNQEIIYTDSSNTEGNVGIYHLHRRTISNRLVRRDVDK